MKEGWIRHFSIYIHGKTQEKERLRREQLKLIYEAFSLPPLLPLLSHEMGVAVRSRQ
jgi:hypothetical protein